MNNWSITEKIYLYLSWDGEHVSVANPESKKFWGPVKKISESANSPLIVDNTGLKIKISDGSIFLEVSGKYLKIKNIYEENILDQITGVTFHGGVADGVSFGFSEFYPDKTVLIFKGTDFYAKAEEEFLRKVSLSLYQKTKKYVPGNRYETEKGSFWYLGTYFSHRGENFYYSNTYTGKTISSHVFSNFLPDSKKLSDILKKTPVISSKKLEYYILSDYPEVIISTTKSNFMVDMGKELDLDISIEDSYEPRIKSFMESNKVEDTFGSSRYYYTGLSDLFSIFDISKDAQNLTGITDDIKNMIKEIISANFEYILYKWYDSKEAKGNYARLTSANKDESVVDALIEIFGSKYLESPLFYYNSEYVFTLLDSVFGVDLKDMAKDSLSKHILNIPSSDFIDFQDYIENIGYTEFRDNDNFRKEINFLYLTNGKRKISYHIPDCKYRGVIMDIYKEAINTNGSNVENFSVENIGTKRTPSLKFRFTITLKDMMNYFGVKSLQELPESIKSDLMKLKIYEISFITGSNINIG